MKRDMNKSRRDFLKKLPLAMSIPFTLGGIPMRVLARRQYPVADGCRQQ